MSRLFLSLILASCLACGPDPRSTAAGVEPAPLETRLHLAGRVTADRTLPISSPMVPLWPMTITAIADPGARIQAGEPVIEFDAEPLLEQRESLRLSLQQTLDQQLSTAASGRQAVAQAEVAVEDARAALDQALLDADLPEHLIPTVELENRRLALFEAQIGFDKSSDELDLARASAAEADARSALEVARARQLIDQLDSQIESMRVFAEADGVVGLATNWSTGKAYAPGDSAYPGVRLGDLYDIDSSSIEADLADVDEGRIHPGQVVEIVPDGLAERRLDGRIRTVETVARRLGDGQRRAFRVRIALDQRPPWLRPGMSVRCAVLEQIEAVPSIDRAALVFRDDRPYRRLGDGRLAELRLGRCSAMRCEVLETIEAAPGAPS